MATVPMPSREEIIRDSKCRVCGQGFTDDDEIAGVVYAGEAWRGEGFAVIEEGAHLYTLCMFHKACEPAPGTNLNDIPEV